jgi:hypothetical protein
VWDSLGEGAGEIVKDRLELVNTSFRSYAPGPGVGPGDSNDSIQFVNKSCAKSL